MAPTIIKYNITGALNGNSNNTFVNLVQFVSDPDPSTIGLYDYLPGHIILLMLFTIIFLGLKIRGNSTIASFTAASLVNFVITILLFPLHVISTSAFVIGIIALLISAFVLFLKTNV